MTDNEAREYAKSALQLSISKTYEILSQFPYDLFSEEEINRIKKEVDNVGAQICKSMDRLYYKFPGLS